MYCRLASGIFAAPYKGPESEAEEYEMGEAVPL